MAKSEQFTFDGGAATYMLPVDQFKTVAHCNGIEGVAGSNPVAPTL